MPVPCPLCGQVLEFDSGGWAYIRSRALLHIQSCKAREAQTQQQAVDLASMIADRMTANPGKEDEEMRASDRT